ncbi:hypothetical protein DXA21_21740, partial [Parabacteroides distasonis]
KDRKSIRSTFRNVWLLNRPSVPLSEMFGYSTDLRSKTQGRGNYSMFFEKYEQAPKSVQDKIVASKAN